jgi:hypothetical protein
MSSKCSNGLDDRCRDEDGTIRQKRGDTHVGTLRDEYGDSFALGYRSDTHLETVLEDSGAESLSEYLKTQRRRD